MKHNKTITYLTTVGIFTALSVILTRYLGFSPQNSSLRLSLGNIPVMLTGIVCGPLYGAICGLLADAIGCFLSGYAPNLPLALAMGMIGAFPPMIYRFCRKKGVNRHIELLLCVSIVLTNLAASLVWKTAVLSYMFGIPFTANLGMRALFVAIETVVDMTALCLLLRNPYFSHKGVFENDCR